MTDIAFSEGWLPQLSWLGLPAEASAQAGATPTWAALHAITTFLSKARKPLLFRQHP